MGHALFSPSASERWLNCPASAILEQDVEETSVFAEEGTLAHNIAEFFLKKWKELHLSGMSDKDIREHIQVKDLPKELREHKSFSIEDVINPLLIYNKYIVDEFTQFETDFAFPEMYVEETVKSTLHKDLSGTPDCFIITSDELHIYDLKFGKGVPVYADHNTQMSCYAVAITEQFNIKPARIVLHIVQPRLQNISTFDFDMSYIENFKKSILEAIKNAESGKPTQSAGTHCKFCKVAAHCKALSRIATDAFNKCEYMLSDEELIKHYKFLATYRKWINTVDESVYKIAVRGGTVDGYKLVEQRTNRKITDTETLINRLRAEGFDDWLTHKTELLSLTELEKLVGKKSKVLDGLTYKPAGALTLAPLSDKRKEVVIQKQI